MRRQKNRFTFIILLALFISSGCVRPDRNPSPFEQLEEENGQKRSNLAVPADGPDFHIIPDSELIFSPGTVDFSLIEAVPESSSLYIYAEEVEKEMLTGVQILERVSRGYSVNPRLLLALLEYRSGWIRGSGAGEFPIYAGSPHLSGLFRQLSWAANEINRGFYTRRAGGLRRITLTDGTRIDISLDVNDASAALQYLFALMMDYPEWQVAVGPLGLFADYLALFGSPQERAVELFMPEDLAQPELRLPFDEEEGWFFTSGPHSAWGSGAAWGALDFAPDDEEFGCYDSDAWVLAAANGLVSRTADGVVLQDLDGDGQEGTGWTILYMHIAERERVQEGIYLKAGGRIGHPSCEGGPATGTHLHLARRFNGEWIPADRDLPFILSGWTSGGDGLEYDGILEKDMTKINASAFPTDENKISP